MEYNRSTSIVIGEWMSKFKLDSLPMSMCVLRACFKAAWHSNYLELAHVEQVPRFAPAFSDCAWWETVQCIANPSKRRKLLCRHAATGRQKTAWENPFVTVWDAHMRTQRVWRASLCEWMKLFPTFLRTWGQRWDLSWLIHSNDKEQYVSPWVDVKLRCSA